MVERAVQALGGAVDPWAYLLLFAMVLLESSAFIGLFVPGETALLLAGVLCQQGKLSLTWCIVIATGGAVVGDSVGYEIGRRWGHRLRSSWLGRKVGRQRWDRARAAVRDKGGRAVLIGRWIGVLRALVPAAAGDAHVNYTRFLAFNAIGAVVQTPAVILAGYFAGDGYRRVERYLGRGAIGVVVLLLAGGLVVHGWRRHRGANHGR